MLPWWFLAVRAVADSQPEPLNMGANMAHLLSKTQRSFRPRLLRTNRRPLAFLWIAPHKTASTFLGQFWKEASQALQSVCWISDTNCLHLQKNCPVQLSRKDVAMTDQGFPACVSAFKKLSTRLKDVSFVYSPLRDDRGSHAASLASSQHELVKIWHHRHPLDVGCSAYVSFGSNHAKPPKISDAEWSTRPRVREIRSTPIDVWVQDYLTGRLDFIRRACADKAAGGRFSSYEEMVTNFERWVTRVAALLDLKEKRLEAFVKRMMAKFGNSFHNDGKHKTSLEPGRYQKELRSATVTALRRNITSSLTGLEVNCVCSDMGYSDFCDV